VHLLQQRLLHHLQLRIQLYRRDFLEKELLKGHFLYHLNLLFEEKNLFHHRLNHRVCLLFLLLDLMDFLDQHYLLIRRHHRQQLLSYQKLKEFQFHLH
jgi:hypothetical protein